MHPGGPNATPTVVGDKLITLSKDGLVFCFDEKANWAQAGFGFGTTIGIGKSTVLALTEGGELVTIKASKEAFGEIPRLQVLGKTCWTTPVYSDDRIYVRIDRGDIVCLSAS